MLPSDASSGQPDPGGTGGTSSAKESKLGRGTGKEDSSAPKSGRSGKRVEAQNLGGEISKKRKPDPPAAGAEQSGGHVKQPNRNSHNLHLPPPRPAPISLPQPAQSAPLCGRSGRREDEVVDRPIAAGRSALEATHDDGRSVKKGAPPPRFTRAHLHMHTRMCTLAHAHTLSHTSIHTHAQTNLPNLQNAWCTLAHAHTLSHTNIHTCAQTNSPSLQNAPPMRM